MSDVRAARYAAGRLKAIAQRQTQQLAKRPRPVRPSEQLRRFQEGEERWRLDQGLIGEDQYQRYVEHMRRLVEGT